MYQLKIMDNKSGFLTFDLSEILKKIKNIKTINLDWYLLNLDAKLKNENFIKISNIIAEIKESDFGIKMNWDEVLFLANNIYQTYDITLIGVKKITISKEDYWKNKNRNFEIAIEGVDSSFWNITARNDNLIKKLQTQFKQTKINELTK